MAANPPRVIDLADADATVLLGGALAQAIVRAGVPGVVVSLEGDLGAGKTTLARGFVRALGHAGNVKSPTYTLVETYPLPAATVHHLDLYRLADPEELEFLGIRELAKGDAVLLVEWAARGAGFLPAIDLVIALVPRDGGRQATLAAHSPRGAAILDTLGFPA